MTKNNKRKVEFALFSIKELNLSEKDMENYAELGLEMIKNDKKELATYAINATLNELFDEYCESEISKSNYKKLRNQLRILVKKGV